MDNNFEWNLGGDFIAHYGTKRHSGRYPWGSGAKNGKTPIHEHGEKKHKGSSSSSNSDIESKVAQARKTGKYAMEFLEQNGDLDQKTGELLKGKDLDNAYRNWLTNQNNFSSKEVKTSDDFAAKYPDMIGVSGRRYDRDKDYQKRMDEAADLGLKALAEYHRDVKEWIQDPSQQKGNREWFLFEDQTIGLPTIADMVNHGKTKEEIKTAIDDAKKVYYSESYMKNPAPGVFDLAESYQPDEFIDNAIKIKSQKSISHSALEPDDIIRILNTPI